MSETNQVLPNSNQSKIRWIEDDDVLHFGRESIDLDSYLNNSSSQVKVNEVNDSQSAINKSSISKFDNIVNQGSESTSYQSVKSQTQERGRDRKQKNDNTQDETNTETDKSAKQKRKTSRSRSRAPGTNTSRTRSVQPPNSGSLSQVRLLSQHCFTLRDEAISDLIRSKPSSDPDIDLEEKIKKRDEFIQHLQEALLVMNKEKERFQTACIDIEMSLSKEYEELKKNTPVVVNDESVDKVYLSKLNEEFLSLSKKEKIQVQENSKISSQKNEFEKQLSELSTEMIHIEFEKKECEHTRVHLEADIVKLGDRLNAIKDTDYKKTHELAVILRTFTEMQKRAEERQSNLERSYALMQKKRIRLEEEKANFAVQNDNYNNDTEFLLNESARYKEMLREVTEKVKKMQEEEKIIRNRAQQVREALIVEKELRTRAEIKGDEEKRERIATCAQLLAMEAANQQNSQRISEKKMENVSEWQEKVEKLTKQFNKLSNQNITCKTKYSELNEEMKVLKDQIEEANANTEDIDEIARLQGELQHIQIQIENMNHHIQDDCVDYEEKRRSFEQLVDEREIDIQKSEIERRRLHNMIQELRGNVRVFARVRPFLPAESNEKEGDIHGNSTQGIIASGSTVEVKPDGISIAIRKRDANNAQLLDEHIFSFDKAFPPTAQQEDVFHEVSEFVQSALDGFNVCLFSYGQTGSGKTYTMQGEGNESERGIIPRAIEQVAQYKKKLEKQGWEYKMQISFLEIYNEKIKDLLVSEAENPTSSKSEDLNIRLDKKGKIYVESLTKINVDPDDRNMIDFLMNTATKQRSIARTDMNAQSSRSHSIFTLYLSGFNSKLGFEMEGQLNLCDLAGSERIEKSGATGQRLVETVNINKSLSSLSDVFIAIGDRRTHIPFRNSKLTYLLMPALSGDGKTLMMINISPNQSNYSESLSTLRFGLNVNQCELGKALKNVKGVDDTDNNNDNDDISDTSSVVSSVSRSTSVSTPVKKKYGASLSPAPSSAQRSSRASSKAPVTRK